MNNDEIISALVELLPKKLNLLRVQETGELSFRWDNNNVSLTRTRRRVDYDGTQSEITTMRLSLAGKPHREFSGEPGSRLSSLYDTIKSQNDIIKKAEDPDLLALQALENGY